MAGETLPSISELFGLNSPRGLLNVGNSQPNGLCTPPASSLYYQPNFEESKVQQTNYWNPSTSQVTPLKNFQRNVSLGSAGTSPCTPSTPSSYYSRSFRSDSCSSNNSPALFEYTNAGNATAASRSHTPDSDQNGLSSPDNGISEILNSMSINEQSGAEQNDIDTSLQNLQVLQALKFLQNPSPNLLNSLLPSVYSGSNGGNSKGEKWSNSSSTTPLDCIPENAQLDRAARFHRSAASIYNATCTWSGVLPSRINTKILGYSSKVFLGGVPWDISEQLLIQTFKQFGPIRVEWPGKEKQASQPKGYAYIIFESEKNVKSLLQSCTNNYANSRNWYYRISSKRMKAKEVEVIPWIINDANYTKSTYQKLDPFKTVFVGALHGMLNAEGLATIMNDLFDGVVYAGIDTDKYKYPIGSGRVTFNNPQSYFKAILAAFVEIKTSKFTKKVQIDPYLEDSLCSICGVQQGPYFCKDLFCFRYFCRICWQWRHNYDLRFHKPMMRNSKNNHVIGFGLGSTGNNNFNFTFLNN